MATNIQQNTTHGKVLIIGGGIAGNAFALFLHKAGIPCAVYEAYPHVQGIGGGLGLAPNGMNVLAELGLAKEVIERSSIAKMNIFTNAKGSILASYANGTIEKYGQPGVSIKRSTLYDILADAVQAQGIPAEFEKRLTHIIQDADKVIAHFDDGTQAEGVLLIGADGINSQTRRSVLPNSPKPEYVGIVGVGGIVPAAAVPSMNEADKRAFHFVFGKDGFFGYSGIGNGELMWWSNLPREQPLTREELTSFSLDSLKQEMLSIYQDYHKPIAILIRNTHSPVKHNIFDIQSLATWHHGRVMLIGDAAHAVSPNTGQGASLALEDALCLAKFLRDYGDYQQAFQQFEVFRKPRVEKIAAEGRRLANDKAIVSSFEQFIREIMLRIFVNLFGEQAQEPLYSYKIAWDEAGHSLETDAVLSR
jgi:2-polyprenyl-6-methoxyphenol hydroxylase-like FAD-dependent oxidoreductase